MKVYNNLSELPLFRNAVLTIGSFDGVHTGHQKIIERVKQIARDNDGESVLITFHPHPRLVINPDDDTIQLLTTIDEKVALLEQYGIDNVVVVPFTKDFSQLTPEEYIENFLVEKFHPGFIVIGYDHRFGCNRKGNIELLQAYEQKGHFELIEIAKQEVDDIVVSSTKIRKSIEHSDVRTAAHLLDHYFTLSGTVVHGQQIGNSLGFPTANIEPGGKNKLIPPNGIYAVFVHLQGQRYEGMLYIGDRPTLAAYSNRTIEVHIFDFSKDIYGDKLKLEFVDHIRNDQQFADLEGLRQQLEKDEVAARKILDHEKKKFPETNEIASHLFPLVAVVILNYNGEAHLKTFLPSVLQTSYPNVEIWLADNASTDQSMALVQNHFPQVKTIQLTENHGFAGGYNEALKQIKADYFVLLNSDVAVEKNWLEPVIELMEQDSTIGVCQSKTRSYREPEKFEYAGGAGGWIDILGYPFCRGRIFQTVENDEHQYDQTEEIFWATGCAMTVRANLFLHLEGLDADYFAHMEEIDFCWRVKRAGYKVMACPESVVYHLGGGTLDYDNPRKAFLNFRNSLFTLAKNETTAALWWKIPARLLLDGVAGLNFLLTGKPLHLWAIVRAHWSFFGQAASTRRKRKHYRDLVMRYGISPNPNLNGRYGGSIVAAYYLRRIKKFKNLINGKAGKNGHRNNL